MDGGDEQTRGPLASETHSPRTLSRVRRLALIGAALLFAGYALPYQGPSHGFWSSLLLGPVGGGFHFPLQQRIFYPLRPVGVVALLLYVSLGRRDDEMNLFGAGAMVGVGVAEGLLFISLLGQALVRSLAIWMGLLGAVVVFVGGLTAMRKPAIDS